MRRTRVSRWAGVMAMALAAAMLPAGLAGAAVAPPCPGAAARVVGGYPLPAGTGEVSGLVASTRYPGWGWMIRDTGHPPDIYAVHFPGANAPHEVRVIRVLGAAAVDWEDIAYQDGKLYVIGSDQGRRARFIYEIPEPDPLGAPVTRLGARYACAYPGAGATTPKRRSSSPAISSSCPRPRRPSCTASTARSPPPGSTSRASSAASPGQTPRRWPRCPPTARPSSSPTTSSSSPTGRRLRSPPCATSPPAPCTGSGSTSATTSKGATSSVSGCASSC